MVKIIDGNFGNMESFPSFAPLMSDATPKDRIKIAAHDLVMQYSVRSVSMDDIASKVGMSKKTIYQYFRDKDELVEAVVEDVLTKNECNCDIDRKNAENAVHEVFLSMDMLTEMFRSMNASVIYDLEKYHPKAFQKFLQYKNQYLYNVIKDNLKRGISEELYRSEINIEILSRYRLELMLLPFNPEFLRASKANLLEAEQEMITHFLFGLVNLKGFKLILKYQAQREKENK
jgi:AcrR family transcriptional regulator